MSSIVGGAGLGQQPIQPGDFLAVILEEHRFFTEFLNKKLPSALSSGDVAQLTLLRDELTGRLSQHTSIEERTFQAAYSKELSAEVLKQDGEEKRAVDAFMRADPAKLDTFTATFSELQRLVLTHIQWEETVGFPWLRANLSAEQQAKFGRDIAALRASGVLPTHPHPMVGPSSSAAAKIMHPIAGVVDKAVDAVTGRHVGSAAGGGASGGHSS